MYSAGISLRAEQRSRATIRLIGVLGCALAIAAGAAAASDHGLLAAAGVAGLAACAAASAIYIRDPVFAFILLWLCVVFDPTLSAVVGYLSPTGVAVRQAFEIPIALFVALTVWRTAQVGTRLPPLRLILPGIGVALFGVLGALLQEVPLTVAAAGAWLGLKLWIMIAVSLLLPWKPKDVERVYVAFTATGCFVALLGIVDYLTNGVISSALRTSGFGVDAARGNSVNSIFITPGAFSLFMSMLFALTFSRFALRQNRIDLALALLFAASAVMSLRLKGFLSLVAVVLIVGVARGVESNRRSLVPLLVGGVLLVGAYSVEGAVVDRQVATYTSAETPRAILYKTGASIAKDEFPVGVGFGRFGSYPSQMHYSPVYDHYGISGVYGLSRTYPEAILDASWATVMGETGIGGLVCYAAGLLILIGSVMRQVRRVPVALRWVPVGTLAMMAVLLVTSTGQGSLFDWLGVTSIALMVGLALAAVAPGSRGVGR